MQGELKDTDVFVFSNQDKVMQRHDLLTGRVGGLGAFAEYNSDLPASFSDNVLRLRPKEREKPRAAFVAEYLNSSIGNMQLMRGSRGSLQKVVTQQSLGEIVVPLLGVRENEFVTAMDAARAERKAKLAEADALLAGVDDYVLDALGLVSPTEDKRRVFAVGGKAARQRFDPHFHSPEFAQIQEMLSRTQRESLGNITRFSKEIWRPETHEQPTFRYIEISAVDPKTGEADWNDVPVIKAPSRARMKIRADDISSVSPALITVPLPTLARSLTGCIASTGFAVIRSVAPHVRRDYLWCVLRAKFCLYQMIQRASGGNYPAITEPELENIMVPIPDMEVQRSIAAEIAQRREEARRLRAEAEAEWQAARRWFEAQLLEADAGNS